MKRLHIHIQVSNLERAIGFYAALFNHPPTKRKKDYANWVLDDPALHLALSAGCAKPGISHLGVRLETATELETLAARMRALENHAVAEKGAHCCYAKSDKYWLSGPGGESWELFRTFGVADKYGDDRGPTPNVVAGREADEQPF